MLPSVFPRLATESPVRVFPGVWKLLSFFKTLPGTYLHPYVFCLSFYLFFFFLSPFEDNGLLFWVPDVLCQHSEVVLWTLFSVQCSFDEFVGEKVVSLSYSSTILGPPPTPRNNNLHSRRREENSQYSQKCWHIKERVFIYPALL